VFGKQHGKLIPALRAYLEQATDAVKWQMAATARKGESSAVVLDGQAVSLTPEELLIESVSTPGFACAESDGYLVALDTRLSPELEREGLAREIVRTIQDARKQAGLAISDRIRLYVGGAPSLQRALFEHQEYVLQETLGTGFVATPQGADFASERDVDGAKLVIALRKA